MWETAFRSTSTSTTSSGCARGEPSANDNKIPDRVKLSATTLITRMLPSVREIDDAVTALRARYPVRPEIITTPLGIADVLDRLESALPGWCRADSGGLAAFTSGGRRYLARPSGTEAATRIYAEAPPESIRHVRAAMTPPTARPGGGSGA